MGRSLTDRRAPPPLLPHLPPSDWRRVAFLHLVNGPSILSSGRSIPYLPRARYLGHVPSSPG
jgi:hypothetical protein